MKRKKNSKKLIIISVIMTAVVAVGIFVVVRKMTKAPDMRHMKPGDSVQLNEEHLKNLQKNAEKNHMKIEIKDGDGKK